MFQGVSASRFVLAQTEQSAVDSEEELVLEEVIVTGSRLKRDSFNVSTPLISMDNDTIRDSGLGALSQILIDEIPQVFEP